MTDCFCGRELKDNKMDIITKYNEEVFKVNNTTVYSCIKNHYKLSRKTRVKIKELLKYSYENNLKEIDFNHEIN